MTIDQAMHELRNAINVCLEAGATKEEINEVFDEELETAEAPSRPHIGGGPKSKLNPMGGKVKPIDLGQK